MYQSHVAIQRATYVSSTTCFYVDNEVKKDWRELYCEGRYAVPLSAASIIITCENSKDMERLGFAGFTSEDTWPRYCLSIHDSAIHIALFDRVTEGCHVLVALRENARIQRYLSGTDNALHDLVTELRYNPAFVGEPARKAAKHFTETAAQGSHE
jgi:hypothetical protein